MDLLRLRTVALMVPSKVEKTPNAMKATKSAKLPEVPMTKNTDGESWGLEKDLQNGAWLTYFPWFDLVFSFLRCKKMAVPYKMMI